MTESIQRGHRRPQTRVRQGLITGLCATWRSAGRRRMPDGLTGGDVRAPMGAGLTSALTTAEAADRGRPEVGGTA